MLLDTQTVDKLSMLHQLFSVWLCHVPQPEKGTEAGINVIKGFIKEKYFSQTTKENETGSENKPSSAPNEQHTKNNIIIYNP